MSLRIFTLCIFFAYLGWSPTISDIGLEPWELITCLAALAGAYYEWKHQGRMREDVINFKAAVDEINEASERFETMVNEVAQRVLDMEKTVADMKAKLDEYE